MQYSNFFTETLQGAAKIAGEMFGKTTSREKHDKSVVTEADLAVGKFIIGEIEKHYPDYNIIDEETGVVDKKSEYTWVIDPIDGTANFAVGVPLYGVMIGLLKGDQPFAGGFILPFFNEIYIAEKGLGAFRNGQKISLKDRADFFGVAVACNITKYGNTKNAVEEQLRQVLEITMDFYTIRGSGSIFDDAMMLRGSYGGVVHNTGKIWDFVPGQIIYEEAGAVSTDLFGNAFDFSDPFEKARTGYSYTNCAAVPSVYKKLQEIIHGTGSPPARG